MLFEDHVEEDTTELCDQADEELGWVEVVAKDELLLLEPVACGVDVVEVQVAVPEPVPHDAWPGGPYPPGKADAPPTAAMKAKVRSILYVVPVIPLIRATILSLEI